MRSRSLSSNRWIGSVRATLLLVGLTLTISNSAALAVETASRSPEEAAKMSEWRGRFCAIGGCEPTAPARLSDIAAFGSTILLGAWWTRRRSCPRP